jgi:glutathione S-transferase
LQDITLAPDGGIDLAPYPNVCAWIRRIQALPGYMPMQGLDT